MRPFQFSIQSGPFTDPHELRRFAVKVEDLGYSELWSYDHIGAVDPFLPLMVAAEATTTLRFGPLVINNEFHNPVLLARTAASFDRLSGGRLILAMGTGYAQDEHDAADIELRPPGRRVTRLAESLSALRTLLDDGQAAVAGRELTVDVDDLGVRPSQDRVPLWVGGSGQRVVSLAGQLADGLQLTGMSHDPATGDLRPTAFGHDAVAQRISWLNTAAGERSDEIDISALVQATTVTEDAKALATASADVGTRMSCPQDVIQETPFVHIGTRQQIVEKLHRLREQFGIHHYTCRDADDFAPIVDQLAGR